MIRWLHITAGRGPQECCWVVFRLVHFLIDQAIKSGLNAELVETRPGPCSETYQSALMAVQGGQAVEHFAAEWDGTAQWVGTSMFRAHHKRKNWFVRIQAFAPVDPRHWSLKDIKIEYMRASGPGGQHLNKTETAVRISHRPTGLVAISQDERSQCLNKRLAIDRLEKRLRNKAAQERKDFEKKRWQQHNAVERGNPVHVFKGRQFIYQS